MGKDNLITIKDNGRGIPTDYHPKYKNKRAFEIVLTTSTRWRKIF